MSSIRHRKAKDNTKVVNLGPLSPQACQEVKGEITEKGDCLGKSKEDPRDPDHVTFERINYQKPAPED